MDVINQKGQTMAESATDTHMLEHGLGTIVTQAIVELEQSHVHAIQVGNGNQNCQLVNVSVQTQEILTTIKPLT